MDCLSSKDAIDDFIEYVKGHLEKYKYREATLVTFHAEHMFQLLHEILIEKKKKEFLEVFRGYTILEEEVRKKHGIVE